MDSLFAKAINFDRNTADVWFGKVGCRWSFAIVIVLFEKRRFWITLRL